jgi:polysaccharide biosynthesis transport protein
LNDDLRFYLGILKRRILPFLAVSGIVGALATVIIFAIPPLYRSEATILVESQQIPEILVKSTVTGFADERVELTRQRITSREELLAIADKYQLFENKRKEISTTAFVKLMRERIIIEPIDLKLKNQRSQENGALAIAFKVGFDYERPETAAKVANELMTLILQADADVRITQATETLQFLEREAQRINIETAKLDEAITKFKLENREALPERVPTQLSALERAETSRKEIDREINSLYESLRLIDLESTIRSAGGDGPNGSANPTTLQGQLELAKSELTRQQVVLSPSHPDIKVLKNTIKGLEKQLALNESEATAASSKTASEASQRKLGLEARIASEKKDAINRQIKLYKSQKESIEEQIRSITRLLSNAPEVQNKLSTLERQRDGLEKMINETAGKLSTARLGQKLETDQQAERFRVIDNPIVPQEPVWPQIPKLLAMGAGVAGLSGATVVGLLELINRSIRSSSDILRAVNRHPIVVVPYIMTKEENRRRIRKLMLSIVGVVLATLLLFLAVHFLFMPLDELYYKLLNRMSG